MAAYASTVTNYTNGIERISRKLGMLCGQINITNYNATTTEETSITRYFKASAASGLEKGILSLQVVSSENGYVLGFNKTTGKFKAYRTAVASVTGNVTVGGGAAGEALGITPDSNSGALTKAAATARTIPIATLLGAAPAVAAAALAEVADDTDLGTFDFVAIGFLA
jgi:hypothetical protein